MDAATKSNRTFERYNPARADKCRSSCHKPNNSRSRFDSFPSREELGISTKPKANGNDPLADALARMDRMSSPRLDVRNPAPYHPSQLSFKALQLTGNTLREIRIVEHLEQDFGAAATEWEARFSQIAIGARFKGKKVRNQAIPVVNDQYMVVGHVITVSGRGLYVPIEEASISRSIRDYLESGVPIYVDNKRCDGWYYLAASEVIFTVLVSIDGEVIEYLGGTTVGVESVDCWVLDAITVGGVIVSVGKTLVKKAAKSMMRRAAKNGTTRSLTGRTVARARKLAGRAVARLKPGRGYIKRSGMPRDHFKAFQDAARETGLMGVVRNTNLKATKLIERGALPKPREIKAGTSQSTGVATAKSREEILQAYRHDYFVVEADGVARRTVMRGGKEMVEELKLKRPFWKVEKGQIIQGGPNPKPLTGDYDLMGVIDPEAMGRNAALATKNYGDEVADVIGPEAARFRNAVNPRLDQPRVMHGPQDQFGGFRKGATVFYPDGRTLLLKTEADVKAFYKSIRRETRTGSYNAGKESLPDPVDQLAARRGR